MIHVDVLSVAAAGKKPASFGKKIPLLSPISLSCNETDDDESKDGVAVDDANNATDPERPTPEMFQFPLKTGKV